MKIAFFAGLLLLFPQVSRSGELFDLPGSKWRRVPALTERMTKHSGQVAKLLTVHYSETKKAPSRPLEVKLRNLFDFSVRTVAGHKKRVWGDIPYHYYLDTHGVVGEARDPVYQPDSNTRYKLDGHISIVVEGNLEDGINEAQKERLFILLKALQEKYGVPLSRVGVHKDYAQTNCPGPAIEQVIRDYKKLALRRVASR